MNALDAINQAKDTITVRRVYGDPYQVDGVTLIPAANVMGGGGGGGSAEGNGGGFGSACPSPGAASAGRVPMASSRRMTSA